MSRLSLSEIYQVALSAGFTPDQAVTWTAIAMAESGGRPDAHAGGGEDSYGLWQINVRSGVRGNTWGDLTDPRVNARAAYEISHRGRDMRPWTTTHASHRGTAADYRTYLDDVEAIAGGAHGDPRGVQGYGSPLPPPLPASGVSAPAMAGAGTSAVPATSSVDTDHDGLTDAFEASLGSNVRAGDTDKDGLTDAYEVVHGSSPTLVDSDRDTLSDSMEAALGTSSTTADTDSDGILDAAEVQMHTDPLTSQTGPVQPPLPGIQPGVQQTAAFPTSAAGAGAGAAAQPASGSQSAVDTFLNAALRQRGDRYIMGAQAKFSDPDPDAFDCAELTRWAAHQAGVSLPDGSWMQYLKLKQQHMLIPVDEAVHTPGALLFRFSAEPKAGGLRPSQSHVAISLGNGKTIEARGRAYGVNEFSANRGFTFAAVIPGISGTPSTGLADQAAAPATGSLATMFAPDPGAPLTAALATTDTDHDGLTDAFEARIGSSTKLTDTDHDGLTDAFEVAQSGTDPTSAHSSQDGLSDSTAYAMGVGPKDTDKDGLSDAYEKVIGTNAQVTDTDKDDLSDSLEVSQGTNPLDADTDHDGITDAAELSLGSDPLKAGTGLGAAMGTPLGSALGVGADGQVSGDPDDPSSGTGVDGPDTADPGHL